jgi:hypothetical protein
MIDPSTVLVHSTDPSASIDNDNQEDEVVDYSQLEVQDQTFDLGSKEGAEQALATIQGYRQQLRDNNLSEYEEKSTEYGRGGRGRLMYDELRADLAVRYWNGEHQLDWQEQHDAAENIKSIRAIQSREQGLWK